VLGESRFEHLMVFLGFVRTAHYWTKVHTELVFEEDVKELLATQEILAECLLNDAEIGTCEISQKLMDERESLRESKKQHDELLRAHQVARDSEERLRHGNAELAERVAELQMASSELQDSLRAAQNLMEDALQARQLAETLNDELRKENSEREQAEEALRSSEGRLRELIEALPAAVYTTDAQGRITMFNQAAVEFSGRVPELGADSWCVSWKLYWPDGTPMRHDQCPMIALKEDKSVRGYEAIAERPDGPRIWFEPYPTPLHDSTGKLIGAVNMLVDVTERKRAEEAIWQSEERLRLLNANLEDVVLERTAELRRTIAERERLQEQLLQAQKMESVGTLASGVAHDFNNLLNIITSYAAIMRLDGKNPATVSEGAAIIEETVRRGATLVHQLMTLVRKGEAEFVSVEINNVAEKLVGLLTETFPKTLVITLELERGLPSIRANENQLHQTLLNLCVNARDAMPEGGRIALKSQTISGAEVRRRMPEADTSRYISISVSDTGMGMDEATRRRIFEPFFTTKPAGQGTGLGLAVVYGIVKNHGGFIEVKSEVGRGTTFCIYLPIPEKVATEISETTASDIARKPAGRGETVLFVDDEEQQLKVMQRFLESEGYKVLGARDGREAVETFKRHKDEIAIAVLDLGLPKLGGWQAFQEMREVRPELKVLVASGFVSAELEVEITQGKLGEIIEKPYRLDEILEKISAAIKP
jgi:two-component system, cell cycle sensor histidine kinase and response regulator CckA